MAFQQAQQGHQQGKAGPGTRAQEEPAVGITGTVYDFDAHSPGMPACAADRYNPNWLAATPTPKKVEYCSVPMQEKRTWQ